MGAENKTVGVSPKVKVPALALGIVGAVLVAASYVVADLENLREVGFTLVGASPLAGLLGYNAEPGQITTVRH